MNLTRINEDPRSIAAAIEQNWWLESDTCKYMLSCVIHYNNKDILTNATKLPAGSTRVKQRIKESKQLHDERSTAKVSSASSNLSVTMSIDDELNGARVSGMKSQIQQNKIIAISNQIKILQENKNLYVSSIGQDEFDKQIVNLIRQLPGLNGTPLTLVLGTPSSTIGDL